MRPDVRELLRAIGVRGFTYVEGRRVAPNQRTGEGGGADVRLYRDTALGDLGAGVSVAEFGYDRNLGFFTLGHGGYFSPQSFWHVGVPLRWKRDGSFRWEVVAEPAFHTFTEASARRFPTGGGGGADYAGTSSSGAAFDGRALLGIALGSHFETTVQMRAQAAPEFSEVQGLLVLRYTAGASR